VLTNLVAPVTQTRDEAPPAIFPVRAGDLRARLETDLPPPFPTGRQGALFCAGSCFHRRRRVTGLELLVDGVAQRPTAIRMPRPDIFRAVHPGVPPAAAGSLPGDPDSDEDPELRCYRSGFWGTVTIPAHRSPRTVELGIAAHLDDGSIERATLGSLELAEPDEPPAYELPRDRPGDRLIAVCMATFDPEPELFRAQVESLRAQRDRDFICIVSDDCSSPERLAMIEETLGEDGRFSLFRSEQRRGFYRNFEHLLRLVPAEAELIALCDHDDRWHPDKLERLRAAIGDAQMVFSDQRLVDEQGRVLADTFWNGRRNNHTNLTSMMIANTITGSASMFRREMLRYALPFPDIPGWQFHDHWLALVALATGRIAYVDRPLYDYVQHEHAVLGKLIVRGPDDPDEAAPRLGLRGRLRETVTAWRADHFCGYLQTEVQAQILLARAADRLTWRKRLALHRMLRNARSPLGLAWLAIRPLRRLVGHNETLGAEAQLVRGIMWRHLIALWSLRRERPGRTAPDASAPPCGAYSPDLKRLRKWRTPVRRAAS
jgi:glycosyltransferase involved in cell wall biosynthesis